MKKPRFINLRLFVALSLLGQTVSGLIGPAIVLADEIIHPQEVTIHYDVSKLYEVDGTFSDGRTLSERTTSLYAEYNGSKQTVFCIEPGISIPTEVTPGYEKNPLPSMSEKAKLVSIFGKKAGTDMDTNMVAQKMIWEEVNGYTLHSIKRLGGASVDIKSIEGKINKAIEEYQKKPSFHDTTAKTILGKSPTLIDKNESNLSEFDEVVQNTANVDYRVSGNQLVLTPNPNSKSGTLTLKKSAGTGTPVAYKKAGLQTVMAGAIDKPNTYTIKIDVETERSVVEFWTVDEFKKVYNYSHLCDFQETFYKRMMRFLFVTGLRSEELFALQWPNIDFKKGTCSVNKSLYIRTRTDYEFSDTKNTSSIRTITLDQQIIEDLKEWQDIQKSIGDDLGFVFTFDGLPPSPKTFLNRIKKLAEEAGVKPIHLHGLRHSHVAFLIEHNKNVYAISKRLGHSSIKTTLDKYGHLYPETNQTLTDEFTKFSV